jgi:hypothetical protein
MIIAPGSTSQPVTVQIVDDNGLAVTGLVAATFPALYYTLGSNVASTAITPLSDLAAITTAFTAKGIKERENGYYRVDVPDAAWATAGTVKLQGEASGKHVICEAITVAYVPANVLEWASDSAGIAVDSNHFPKVDTVDFAGTPQTTGADLGVLVPDCDNKVSTIVGKLPTHNIADETVILAAIGTPIQAGNVTVGGYAGGQDPATLVLDVAANIHNTAGPIGSAINASASGSGPGGTICKILIKSNGIPIPQAEVWLTSDPNGTTVIAGSLLTDSNGYVSFMLTVGNTYYLWMRKDGFTPIQGATYIAAAG